MKSIILKKLTSIFLIVCMLAGFVTITANAKTNTLTLTFEDDTKQADASLLENADGTSAVSTQNPPETTKGWWITDGQLKYGNMTSEGSFSAANTASGKVYIGKNIGGSYSITINDASYGKNDDFLWFNYDKENSTGYRIKMNWAGAYNNDPAKINKYRTASNYDALTCTMKFYIDGEEKTQDEWNEAGITTDYQLRKTAGEIYTLSYNRGKITLTVELTTGGKVYKTIATYEDDEPYTNGVIGFGGNTTNYTYIKDVSIEYETMTAQFPDLSQRIPSEEKINIEFSHKLDLETVKNSMKVNDSDGGECSCELSLDTEQTTVSIDVSKLLETESYSISINGLVSADGYVMEDVQKEFSVENPVKIIPLEVTLPDFTNPLPKNELIYIEFSEPVDIDALKSKITITDSEGGVQNCNIADVSETKKSIDISTLSEGSEYTLSITELVGGNGGILNEKTAKFTVAKLFEVKSILPANNAILSYGEKCSFSIELITNYSLSELSLYIDDEAVTQYSVTGNVYSFEKAFEKSGNHTFVFKATDIKGNTFESSSYECYVSKETQAIDTTVMESAFEESTKAEDAVMFVKTDGSPAISTQNPSETAKAWWITGGQLKYGNMSPEGKFSASTGGSGKVYTKYAFGKKYELTVSDVSVAKNQETLWFNYDRAKGTGYSINLNWVGTSSTLKKYSSSSASETLAVATQFYIDGVEKSAADWAEAGVTGSFQLRKTVGEKYTLSFDEGVIVFSVELTSGGKTYKSVCSYIDSEPYLNGCIGFGGGSVDYTYISGISVEYAPLNVSCPEFTEAISAKEPIQLTFSDEVDIEAVKSGLRVLNSKNEAAECPISLDDTSKIVSVDISSLTGGKEYTLSLEGILSKNGYILNEQKYSFSVIKIFDIKEILPSENTVIQNGKESTFSIEIQSGYGIASVSLIVDDKEYKDYTNTGNVFAFNVTPSEKGYHTFTFDVVDNDNNRYKETRAFYVMGHSVETKGFCALDGSVIELLPQEGIINAAFSYSGDAENVTAVIALYSESGALEKLVYSTVQTQNGSADASASYEFSIDSSYKRAIAYIQSDDRNILSPPIELIAE